MFSLESYSVVINGRIGVRFKPNRGLRQGDPLSPFLFLLCDEGLSSLMRLAMRDGKVRGAKLAGVSLRFHIVVCG